MCKRILENEDEVNKLVALLEKCPEVKKLSSEDSNESGTLAHAFSDLEESFRIFSQEQLPRLVRENLKPKDVFDLLLDIGEELRHVLYHINDSQFYSYLSDGSEKTGDRITEENGELGE